ncbi:hypothetical protein [Streptomyces noursei]|uniref:hypothetical protein n=1 Tax=Streptomyces noursei TaxID=1971 RepID=UPI00167210F5|nr:hypothetical protein [Streptomyces noursei]MCZ1021418.1 hypothetical protein [Streptomyces noursei]
MPDEYRCLHRCMVPPAGRRIVASREHATTVGAPAWEVLAERWDAGERNVTVLELAHLCDEAGTSRSIRAMR